MSISVVIPACNEAESIVVLIDEITAAACAFPLQEIVVVDDGSDDSMPALLAEKKKSCPPLRVIRHTVRSGQSTATWTGINNARGTLIVTMDGDGQNDPADIGLLHKEYLGRGQGKIAVCGQRHKRQDNFLRRLSSRVANKVRAAILQDGVRDTGCSLKLFRREDYLLLPFFNHQHRFLPALLKGKGVALYLVDVGHRPRLRGVSKYGLWDRLWVGIADLFGVRWLLARTKPFPEVKEP